MITKTAEQFQVQGNLPGQKIKMGIADQAVPFIMNTLSKTLYSNPKLAVLREYSCNALDAHIAAGNPAPIEVQLPSALAPFLRIKDFGVGLSLDDLTEIYSQYGVSTKRDSNSQIGAFGLGCKSAFAYTNQFTLVATKGGITAQVAVTRAADGSGELTVVSQTASGAPNGVEVVIPVGRYDFTSFADAAEKFFRFWKPGQVLVNGSEPKFFARSEALELDKNIWLTEDVEMDTIIMGGVAYPSPSRLTQIYNYSTYTVAEVPLGSVNLPPTRESILDDADWNRVCQDLLKRTKVGAPTAVQRKVDAAATPAEAARAAHNWHRNVFGGHGHPRRTYTYKGSAIPEKILDNVRMIVLERSYGRLDSHSEYYQGLSPLSLASTNLAIFTGFSDATWTATKRKKLNEFFIQIGKAMPRRILILENPPSAADAAWITAETFNWADVKAIKLKPSYRRGSSGRLPGSYDLYKDGEFKSQVVSDDIDPENLLFIEGNRYAARSLTGILDSICEDGYTLVPLGANRIEKFQRTFPEANEAFKFVTDEFENWKKSISEIDRQAFAYHSRHAYEVTRLDSARVNDVELLNLINLANRDISKHINAWNAYRNVIRCEFPAPRTMPALAGKVRERYPLLNDSALRLNPDEVYDYLAWKLDKLTSKP